MKIRIVPEHQLQSIVDHSIQDFQSTLNSICRREGMIGKIDEWIRSLDHPVDYRELADWIRQFPKYQTSGQISLRRQCAGRLNYLTNAGFLRIVGRGEPRYPCLQGALLYGPVPLDELPQRSQRSVRKLELARKRLYNQIETYPQLFERTVCLQKNLRPYGGNARLRRRNIKMVQSRFQGKSLTSIGKRFHITRERVRQIVELSIAIAPQPRKKPKKRAHRQWSDEMLRLLSM